MIITIASGKGGTGKTLVSTNLAVYLAESDKNTTYMDCDVEEPNGHIFLKPKNLKTQTVNIPVPIGDEQKCTHCFKCAEVCQFHAILPAKKLFLIFEQLCHGCGSCILACPQHALSEKNRPIGVVEMGIANVASQKPLHFFHGKLNVGEPMAPPIIKALKKHIKGLSQNAPCGVTARFRNAHLGSLNSACSTSRALPAAFCDSPIKSRQDNWFILDAPPGTSCSVVETVLNSDFVILVTEPTPFGLHDLTLAVEVVRKLNVPFGVVINKSGLGDDTVTTFCAKNKIRVLLSIPHDKSIAQTYSKGELLIETTHYKKLFKALYNQILEVSK